MARRLVTSLVFPPGRPPSGGHSRERVLSGRPVRDQEGRCSFTGQVQVALRSDFRVAEEQDPADRNDKDPHRVTVYRAPVVQFSPCRIAATTRPIQATLYQLYRPVTASPMK